MALPNIVVCSIARTPIAKFRGSFASLKASELGSIAIRGAMGKLDDKNALLPISEVILGNVVSAGIGQAPCRQAVLGAGLPESTICTTINKVCASGMKSVILSAQTLQCQNSSAAMIAGGTESMSNIPHYLPALRSGGVSLGNTQLVDGVIHDGLWDVYNNQHMGSCAEVCAKQYQFSRPDQDDYAKESYRRAQQAIAEGLLEHEHIVPVSIPQKRKKAPLIVTQDEEPTSVQLDKLSTLSPAFDRSGSGTVTAANASSLNDGACAMVLMTEHAAQDRGLTPLFRILGWGEAAQAPVDFTTAPSLAVPIALKHAGNLAISDVDYHEINEAFAVVALANQQLLGLDADRVNVFGGAVALGHPIGMSGARIIGSLYNVLKQKDASIGCASICNGGGGASAMVMERMN